MSTRLSHRHVTWHIASAHGHHVTADQTGNMYMYIHMHMDMDMGMHGHHMTADRTGTHRHGTPARSCEVESESKDSSPE